MTANGARLIWVTAIVLIACTALAALWAPVTKMFADVEINYNEGWNAYRVAMLENGERLYAAPPAYTGTNYPPLSFHAIALLAKVTGDANVAGRWTALLSLFGICAFAALIVRRFSGAWLPGAYAGLTFLVWIALFTPDRVGMNDPQLLAMLLMMAGLFAYIANRASPPWLCASAALFALALFTKHNLIAVPCAVGLHLLLSRWRRGFLIWAAVFCGTVGALFVSTRMVDGPFFLAHLTALRAYSFIDGWARFSYYLWIFQIGVAAAAVWALWNARRPERQVLILAFILATLTGLAFAGGNGVDYNIFFDSMLMVVLIVSICVADLISVLEKAPFGAAFLTAALLLPFLGAITVLPLRLQLESHELAALADAEDDAARAIETIRGRPGAALCEDLLYCLEAGKPYAFDPYCVYNQVKTGRIPEEQVLAMLRSHQFATIEISLSAEPLQPVERARFSAAFMHALLENYHPVLTTRSVTVLAPL